MAASLTGVRHVLAAVTVLAIAYAVDASLRAADQLPFSRQALDARTPVERIATYRLNGRVRPMLFWIGRDDIGEASVTWRRQPSGRRALELLVGSDPARAPRHINRWGYIVEEFDSHGATIFGLMKESSERTLEEAEANVQRQERLSVFKAAHATVIGRHFENIPMTIKAPTHLSYKDVDAVLAIAPSEASPMRRTTMPPGTLPGFLVALETLIGASLAPCESQTHDPAKSVPAASYVYNQTLFDLTLASCDLEPELHLDSRVIENVIDARFRLRNRTTKHDTRFRIVFGTAGDFRGVPIRAVFRPQWWMEVELELSGDPGSLVGRPKEPL